MKTTFTNPIYDRYFADPFVLEYRGTFYAYGTAPPAPDGRRFPVLSSANMVDWSAIGHALEPIDGGIDYWSPEVVSEDGRFYMYYSASGIGGRDHQLRVAASDQPVGPFRDCGHNLTPHVPFAIDAHPFKDADGHSYLFYSTDFLEMDGDYRVGTGIVVDRLLDVETLAGEPRVVVRPHADWQLFMAQRPMYGSIYDWHTVEGAAMRMHNGRYYCFYSGGAWQRDNYGVSYVVAEHPLGPYHTPPHQSGALLCSIPGHVRGPGHNSFVTTPGGEEYMVYHAWDARMTARLMRLDRLLWENDIPVIDGPTWTPQPLPEVKNHA